MVCELLIPRGIRNLCLKDIGTVASPSKLDHSLVYNGGVDLEALAMQQNLYSAICVIAPCNLPVRPDFRPQDCLHHGNHI